MREFEVIDHAESPIGVLILRRRTEPVPGVIELALDHQFLMSSAVTVSERELATRAIAMHGGRDLDVLIGGLGLGYTCKAALDSARVARVEVIELVQAVIDWVAGGVIPKLGDHFDCSAFAEGLRKNDLGINNFMEKVPALLITHEQPGLLGCHVRAQL